MIGWVLCIGGAYILGSIPFGYLLGRARGLDIRQHGSKNVGATNVGRVLGQRLGFICFMLDTAKGAVPVLVAGVINGLITLPITSISPEQMWLWLAVACAAVLGHMHSLFLGLRGGKGVATGFGAMLAMWPLLTFPALGAMVVWYGMLRVTRYVSVASMTASLSLPLAYLVRALPPDATDVQLSQTVARVVQTSPPLIITTVLALLIVFKHRTNIARLRRGEEPESNSS
ncbi:MAG: glycerol-3-phosphate 1-O-acyltransferase PlsY [Phycisphaerales bacterium]